MVLGAKLAFLSSFSIIAEEVDGLEVELSSTDSAFNSSESCPSTVCVFGSSEEARRETLLRSRECDKLVLTIAEVEWNRKSLLFVRTGETRQSPEIRQLLGAVEINVFILSEITSRSGFSSEIRRRRGGRDKECEAQQ